MFLFFFDIYVGSIVYYGCEVWGFYFVLDMYMCESIDMV